MKLIDAYGPKVPEIETKPVEPLKVKKVVKKNTKIRKNNLIRLGKYLEKTLGSSSAINHNRDVYFIHMQVDQDDCHIVCLFVLVFLITILLSRK